MYHVNSKLVGLFSDLQSDVFVLHYRIFLRKNGEEWLPALLNRKKNLLVRSTKLETRKRRRDTKQNLLGVNR